MRTRDDLAALAHDALRTLGVPDSALAEDGPVLRARSPLVDAELFSVRATAPEEVRARTRSSGAATATPEARARRGYQSSFRWPPGRVSSRSA